MSKETKETNITVVEKLSKFIYFVTLFLVPIFFLPITSEFFEFNKLALLVLGTVLLLIAASFKTAFGGKFEITRSAIDLPIVIMFFVILLSSIFSVNKTASIFGAYARWFPSLFGFAVLAIYFYLTTPMLKTVASLKTALYLIMTSATISSLVAILSYFKIYLGSAAYMKIQNFTLTGSITTTALLSAIGFVIAFTMLSLEKSYPTKITLTAIALTNFFYLALANVTAAWVFIIVAAIGSAAFISFSKLAETKVLYLVIAGGVGAILLTILVPTTKNILIDAAYPKEMVLPLRESWVVSLSTVQDYPTLATGPSTFGLNYPRYKTPTFNGTNFWNVQFDKPNNEILNITGTMGLFGILATVMLGAGVSKVLSAVKSHEDESNGLVNVLAVLALSAFSIFFFTYATVLNTFLAFSFLGMLLAAGSLGINRSGIAERVAVGLTIFKESSLLFEEGVVKKEYFKYISIIPVLALTGYVGYLYSRNYSAEVFMRRSLLAAQQGNGTAMYANQQKAIQANPSRDIYHTAYAQTNLILAENLSAKENLTDTEKQTIQSLVSQAIRSVRAATEVVNPLNVSGWTARADIYKRIANVAKNATEWATGAYNTAIQLDPTNPRLRVELGQLLFAQKDYYGAANQFRQAIILKSDYANAHFNFAVALAQLNDVQSAQKELEVTKGLVAQGSEDYKRIEQELLNLASKQPAVAGATDQKPTVEELSGTGTPTTQEPIDTAEVTKQATPSVN